MSNRKAEIEQVWRDGNRIIPRQWMDNGRCPACGSGRAIHQRIVTAEVKQWMTKAGYTGRRLADVLGMGKTYINKIMSEQKPWPARTVLFLAQWVFGDDRLKYEKTLFPKKEKVLETFRDNDPKVVQPDQNYDKPQD